MAGDLRGFALENAEQLSGRLKELLSSGQGYVRTQFGLDLGLKPEQYPTWVILSTAAAGLLLLLTVSWAAVCGRVLAGKKRASPVTQAEPEPVKAVSAPKAPKQPEEQKKKNKKKATEKAPQVPITSGRVTKPQSNGQPVIVAQEEVKVKVTAAAAVVSKPSPKIKAKKVPEVQAPVQVKKNKKKPKTDVKPVPFVRTTVSKEPDDGAWETMVSNREKKQQRRKEKGPEDSGSSGGLEAPKSHVNAATTNTKKNKRNQEMTTSRTTAKVDAASGGTKVSTNRREEPSVNGVGWTDISMKIPGQMNGAKWRNVPTAPQYSGPAEPQRWTQEAQAAWSGIDGGVKTDLNPMSFSTRRLNTSEPKSNSIELQWVNNPGINDEWSGLTADPSSDWSAPAEHWGNYEEPPVLVKPAAPLKEQPAPNKGSDNDKNAEDPSGEGKSKKKRKKKKKTDEEAASESPVVSAAPAVNSGPKPQALPVPPQEKKKKQNSSISSSQKTSEQTAEPPKASQKKKLRRET